MSKKPLKIAVYTLAKNESKHIKRWFESAHAADTITFADTGSDDGTFELAQAFSTTHVASRVHRISIDPWRFDDAHNAALAPVPADADVCIPLHLDEVLMPGWREALEAKWIDGATKAFYTYVFSHNEDGTPELEFQQNRIHARRGYRWRYPAHEGVYPYMVPEKTVHIPELRIEQWQDRGKPRSALPLLLMGLAEGPNDSRMIFYTARELYYLGQWEKALSLFKAYFNAPGGFPVEQAEAAQCMATCYRALAHR